MDNNSSDDVSLPDDCHGGNATAIVAFKAISIVVISILICGLNFLVSYTLHKKPHLQNPGNKFVLSMAISNLIFGAVVLPCNFISCVCGEWIFGIMMCNLTGFITMTVFTGSMLSILVITIDRYYAILQPMAYPAKLTSRRTKELIISIWTLSLFGSLPPLFGWSRYTWLETTSNCIVQWDLEPSFAYTFTAVFLILPLLTMFFCYARILKVARLTSRRTSNGNIVTSISEINPTRRRRSRRTSLLVNIRMNSPTKATRTVAITLGTLLFTIGPLSTIIICQATLGVAKIPAAVLITATWLFFCSFFANSCIYAVWNKSVRRELLGYFCARGRCMDDDDDPLFQHVRKGSRTVSISGSISDLNNFTTTYNSQLPSHVTQNVSTNDQSTVLTCIEESEDTEILRLPESLHKQTSTSKNRTESPVPGGQACYTGECQPSVTLPVVVEVHIPGTASHN